MKKNNKELIDKILKAHIQIVYGLLIITTIKEYY